MKLYSLCEYFFFDSLVEFFQKGLPQQLDWKVTLGLFFGHSNIFIATAVILFFLQQTKKVVQDQKVRNGIEIYQTFIFFNGVAHLSNIIVSYTHDYQLEVLLTIVTGLYATYTATQTNVLLRYLHTFVSPKRLESIKAAYAKKLDKRIEIQFDVVENLQRRFLYYINHNPIPALIINQDLRVDYYSDSYLEYFSIAADQVKGKTIAEVLQKVLVGYPKLLDKILFAIKNNKLIDEVDFIKIFGNQVDVRYKIVPVSNLNNKCIGAIFYFEEIEKNG